MAIESKIRKQGGAAIMTIPPAVMKLLNLEVGASVSLTVANGELVARPVTAKRRYSLRELLEGCDAMAALNAETEWAREGDPAGRELS